MEMRFQFLVFTKKLYSDVFISSAKTDSREVAERGLEDDVDMIDSLDRPIVYVNGVPKDDL